MTIATINKPSRAPIAARTAGRSLKFERTGQPALHDKSAIGIAAGALHPVDPLFLAAFYYLFTPAAYPVSQNLILLVMS